MIFSLPVPATFSAAFAISHGERNWPFFMFATRPERPTARSRSVCRHRNAGICNTSHTSAAGPTCDFVYVCEYRQSCAFLYVRENAQTLFQPWPAIRRDRRAVCFVVGCLEDQGNPKF